MGADEGRNREGRDRYTVEDGRIVDPGKFQGEPPWAPAAYEASGDGTWEEHGSVTEGGYGCWTRIDDELVEMLEQDLSPEDREACALSEEVGRWLVLEESSQGFVNVGIVDEEPAPEDPEEGDEGDEGEGEE